ncbi:Protein of unknown function [Rubritalea squalenifaciens DSM 18772]|uniref:DUF3592 domain-containing protein n=1 Tax=Rubritalea squalenifaciens DSM 18772 TaxID=1123071 RepID=A0A1M6IWR5_9BACT|nr:DUF3592 domain-containing protein [Rubritalea squalenifaciens]SHJ38814.1 Protein of unknown function [Rubritalea squalenifaciens DSM 18772]
MAATQKAKGKNKAGAIYLMCIGLFLVLIGGLFTWLMVRSFQHASDTRHWSKAPCYVIRSEAVERSVDSLGIEFQWAVAYTYEFEGKDYIGEKYKPRGQKWTGDKENVQALIDEYPLDTKQECYVNPQKPDEAILDHDSKAAGYSAWFPMLFVVGGLGMIFGALKNLLKLSPKS